MNPHRCRLAHLLVPALVLGLLPLLFTRAAEPDRAATLPANWLKPLTWRCIGPANMGGRIAALSVYEADPSIYWVATASGGLLKTTNNGITFEHQFDHEATVSIGDVCVAPSNKDIVWVGTGENNPRNSVSYGDGVYKSTDGGKTWKNMGLKKSFQIGRILVHPKNPDIVYVGALGRLYGPNEERGLFKTTDGGKTWEKILYVDDKTGVIDLRMHPADPETLLAAAYERQRDGYDANDPVKKIGRRQRSVPHDRRRQKLEEDHERTADLQARPHRHRLVSQGSARGLSPCRIREDRRQLASGRRRAFPRRSGRGRQEGRAGDAGEPQQPRRPRRIEDR